MGFLKQLNIFRRQRKCSNTVKSLEPNEEPDGSPKGSPALRACGSGSTLGSLGEPEREPAPPDGAAAVQDLTGDDSEGEEAEIEFVPSAVCSLPSSAPAIEEDDPCEASLEAVDEPRSQGPVTRHLELGPAEPEDAARSAEAVRPRRFQDSGPLPRARECKPRTGLQLQGLMVRGRNFKQPLEPTLPGMMQDDPDEFLMDGILEETGMAFGSTGMATGSGLFPGCSIEEQPVGLAGLGAVGAPGCFAITGSSMPLGTTSSSMPDVGISMADSSQFMAHVMHLEEEHMRLEADLMHLGLDMADLDEQEALLQSLEPSRGRADEVAVLLESLQAELSIGSMQSIEAC